MRKFLIIIIGCFGILAHTAFSQMMARPAGVPLRITLSPTPPVSEYDRLLVAYLRGIEQITQKNLEGIDARYRADKDSQQKIAENFDKMDMTSLLTKLRAGAKANPGNRLDTDEPAETTIYPYVLGCSPASARLVQLLYQEGLIKEWSGPLSLLKSQPKLCPEWLALVETAAIAKPDDKKLAEFCAKILYSNGFKPDQYRPLLLKWAVDRNDVRSLELLLFHMDEITGRLQPTITIENIALARQLAGKDRPPNIRVTCAHFATEVYDVALAEEVCLSLLCQDYHGVLRGANSKLSKEEDDADADLFHARQAALIVGFYGVRGERIFKEVFRLAKLSSPDASSIPTTPGAIPPNSQTVLHMGSRFDCERANELLGRVRELVKIPSDPSDTPITE